jgi:hypothetical protein
VELISILAVAGALVLILLFVALLRRAFVAALNLLAWALEWGFFGGAVYIACWVLMLPVMVVICFIGGLFVSLPSDEEPYKVKPNTPRNNDETRC